MSDPDSNNGPVELPPKPVELPIGSPIEPEVLPTGQEEETPEQQKEFDLGFEYGRELLRLENKLDLLNADIHSLKYPLGNPEKNLERVAQRKELEDKAAEVERRIDFIRQWFATKPADLAGIATDIDPPTASPEVASTHSQASKAEPTLRKPSKRDDWFIVIRDTVNEFKGEHGRFPNETEIWARLRTNPPTGYGITAGKDRREDAIFMGGKPLGRAAFKRRWERYTNPESNDNKADNG